MGIILGHMPPFGKIRPSVCPIIVNLSVLTPPYCNGLCEWQNQPSAGDKTAWAAVMNEPKRSKEVVRIHHLTVASKAFVYGLAVYKFKVCAGE